MPRGRVLAALVLQVLLAVIVLASLYYLLAVDLLLSGVPQGLGLADVLLAALVAALATGLGLGAVGTWRSGRVSKLRWLSLGTLAALLMLAALLSSRTTETTINFGFVEGPEPTVRDDLLKVLTGSLFGSASCLLASWIRARRAVTPEPDRP